MSHAAVRFVLGLVSVFLLTSVVTAAGRTVVIVEDETPFTVSFGVVVRLTGEGIGGARITAQVQGPAKIIAENYLRWVAQGEYRIGMGSKEFEIMPTGKGRVVVTITSTSPIPGENPTTTKYQFDVQ